MKRLFLGLLSALLVGGRRYVVEYIHRGRRSGGAKHFWSYREAEQWFEQVKPIHPHIWIVDTWREGEMVRGLRLLECDNRALYPDPRQLPTEGSQSCEAS